MSCRIGIITDIHYSRVPSAIAARKTLHGASLLRQTVDRVNRQIKPDAVAVLGDLIDDPASPDAAELLTELRVILEQLDCPWLVIPGNHDPSPDAFYAVLPKVHRLDVRGVRLACFVDDEAPGHNATRSADAIAHMTTAVRDHAGMRVALQHVPVSEIGREARYGYTNYPDVAAAMRQHGYVLAISGHYHRGQDLIRRDGITSLVVPALCEAPYAFGVVTIDGADTRYERFEQQLPQPSP